MQTRNQKIIEAIIAKANRDCPGSLALIGIYGSCLTGDTHEKSDLDLLILINDDRGYCLAKAFLQDDIGIGHDLYCTTWEALEWDAQFRHPHISKLMDSRIVYLSDPAHLTRLEELRRKAMSAQPQKYARDTLEEAYSAFGKAVLTREIGELRMQAGLCIRKVMDSLALLNGQYFHLGVRRVFEELEAMENRPENLRQLVVSILTSEDPEAMKSSLGQLLEAAQAQFPAETSAPVPCSGAYEEMVSNWRSKMLLASKTGNIHLSFDSLASFENMLRELGCNWDVLSDFDPNDLHANVETFDRFLARYKTLLDKAGIPLARYKNIDQFIGEYMKKESA